MLPLCDITRVERLGIEEHGPFTFSVVCPPAQLTLKANDAAGCDLWIRAITRHAQFWKAKSNGGAARPTAPPEG